MRTVVDYAANHFLKDDAFLIAAAWVSTLAGAIIYYAWQHPGSNKSIKGFFVYSLPKELWSHPSCRLDYAFAVINRIIEPVTIGVVLITTSTVSFGTHRLLVTTLGQHAEGKTHILTWIALTFVVIMVRDFFVWYSHYLEHKIPMLWQIHACHHSAEFLNPLSNRRHHPLQLVWEGGISNVAAGITLAVFSYMLNVSILDTALLGVDAYFVCDVLSFYQLRHSHIPLHYGKWEKWFLSPSMHQLHHSVEAKYWDKNFGLFTAIWDRVFNTLNIRPVGYEYRQGVQPQHQRDYDTVSKLYFTPLVNLAKIASGEKVQEPVKV